MEKEKKKETGAETETPVETGEAAAEREAPPINGEAEEETEPLSETDLLKKKIEESTAELKAVQDKQLRAAAEFDNSRKRMKQDFDSRIKFATLPLGEGFISGLDNFERALEHAKKENISQDQFEEFIKGIEMIYQQFMKNLEDNGYQRIHPKGETFDPEKHEAVGMVETDEVEPGQVANVFKAGYRLHDRVVRPAMVQVAKEKTAEPETSES